MGSHCARRVRKGGMTRDRYIKKMTIVPLKREAVIFTVGEGESRDDATGVKRAENGEFFRNLTSR